MGYRAERAAPPDGFQGEGLLAVLPGDGSVRLWTAPDPTKEVPSIRLRWSTDRFLVSADGPVEEWADEPGKDAYPIAAALAAYGDRLAAQAGVSGLRSLGPGWCSWYWYRDAVTEADVDANLAAADRLALPIRVFQLDDGYQGEIGDWLDQKDRFDPIRELADRIRDSGREAGLWTAPLLVGTNSRVAREHPDWLVRGAVAAARHWDQEIRVLDVTHPGARDHLVDVFRTLRAWGFTYHKLDFLYGGALEGGRHADVSGIAAYREGLRLIRDAVGSDATLLGCGAPLLPSVGLVDAMRISPDVAPQYQPESGDLSQPSVRAALAAGRARAWMHGRLWVNDPDCLLARSDIEHLDEWVAHVEASGGLVVSSDPLDRLDPRGVEITRRLLRPSIGASPLWNPFAGPDQGRLSPA